MQLKQQYFELVTILNKTNRSKNLNTTAKFSFDKNYQKLYLKLNEKQKILLVEKNSAGAWNSSNITKQFELEEFVAKMLIRLVNHNLIEIDVYIKSALFKLSD